MYILRKKKAKFSVMDLIKMVEGRKVVMLTQIFWFEYLIMFKLNINKVKPDTYQEPLRAN